MKTLICAIALLSVLSCSAIDPGGLPGAHDFERWQKACAEDGAISAACLRAQAVAWALDAGHEGNLLSVLADLWAWWATTPHAAEALAPTLSGEVGACPTSPLLWRGYYAPALDTWHGSSDQVLPIWGVVFSCVGRPERGDYVLDNGVRWSQVLRRFERQVLESFGDEIDCEPAPVPVACEEGQGVALRWARSGDAVMRRADVFGYAAQALARHGGEVYGPWGVTIGAPVAEYRTAGLFLSLCGLDSIACPPRDEAAGEAVLRALP